jgi:polysaccharide biosynthesis/export protein
MVSRLAAISAVLGLALSGCAHQNDEDMAGVGAPQGWAASVHAPGIAVAPVATQVTWGAPTVIPTGVTGGGNVEADDPYLLDTGDRLRVFVYGQPNLSRLYTVDHEGRISVPLIGHVKARGVTTKSLEQAIKAKLGSQYVKDPQVTVDIAQNRPFYILGEVRNAGQYPFVSGMSVQTAVAIAGGYSERANERKVQITRRNNGFIEKMDVPNDYVLQPGDTLYIYERWF